MRIYVPMLDDLHTLVLSEVHCAPYHAHLKVKKMHANLKKIYFWVGMRHNVADFVARCLECQRVKVEHQHPSNLLQPHTIPKWKWDMISIDFIIGLPMSSWRHDCIMVTMDKLSKVAHFSPMRASYTTSSVVHVFLEDIVCLHDISHWIILDSDPVFTSAQWMSLQHALAAQLNFSLAHHLETDG